jgi:hypothetical protein
MGFALCSYPPRGGIPLAAGTEVTQIRSNVNLVLADTEKNGLIININSKNRK